MQVTLYCADGEGEAVWVDECGALHEEYLGEVSDDWLENEAEAFMAKMLGEDISLDIVDAL
jgi:hypothetical protein